jgi:SAM-dependent methyltransferase
MSVSEEEVMWCYRNLLGREPESLTVVHMHFDAADFKELVKKFTSSNEFVQLAAGSSQVPAAARPEALPLNIPSYPLNAPANVVEFQASPAQFAAITAEIKKAWTHLGKSNPHFSVLTNPSYLPENLDKNIEEFWATGAQEVDRVIPVLERHGFGPTAGKIAVEYGCGVGRVTTALGKHFSRVHGYDISPEHLKLATQRAQAVGAANAEFHECSVETLGKVEKCDFYYSRIVFQHNPPPVIHLLIQNALKALNPGGIALFQIPVYSPGYRFKIDEWLAQDHALDMQMHCLPQQHIFRLIQDEGCLPLEVREDDSAGTQYLSNLFVVTKPAAEGRTKAGKGKKLLR